MCCTREPALVESTRVIQTRACGRSRPPRAHPGVGDDVPPREERPRRHLGGRLPPPALRAGLRRHRGRRAGAARPAHAAGAPPRAPARSRHVRRLRPADARASLDDAGSLRLPHGTRRHHRPFPGALPPAPPRSRRSVGRRRPGGGGALRADEAVRGRHRGGRPLRRPPHRRLRRRLRPADYPTPPSGPRVTRWRSSPSSRSAPRSRSPRSSCRSSRPACRPRPRSSARCSTPGSS